VGGELIMITMFLSKWSAPAARYFSVQSWRLHWKIKMTSCA